MNIPSNTISFEGINLTDFAENQKFFQSDSPNYIYKTAKKGDYYDVLQIEGVVTLAIGDVTGHGLESGILMLMAQTLVRTLQEIRELDPVRFLDVLNRTPLQKRAAHEF